MAFTPVKSYNFGGLRATNSSGPIASKQRYGGLAGLLNGGLRATDSSGPIPQGFNTGITAGTGAAPSAQARAQVGAGGGFAPPTPDQLSQDPILQQIRAAGQMAVQQARQGALANAENSLIGYGGTKVPDSLRSLYGGDTSNPILAALTDSATAQAAEANPDSTLKQLARTDLQNNAGIDQGENANNLFYSSDRGNRLGAEADQYRGAQGTAAQNLAGLLGQANQGVLDTENQANQDFLGGLSGAWDRYLQLQSLLGGAPAPAADTTYASPTMNTAAAGTPGVTAGPGGLVQPRAIGPAGSFWQTLLGGGTPTAPSRRF